MNGNLFWEFSFSLQLLQENGDFDDIQSWPVIGQFSSIGSLGKDTSSWLCGEWMESLTTTIKSKRLSSSSTLHLVPCAALN